MAGQLLYDTGGVAPQGVVIFKLYLHSVETSVSTLPPIQDSLLLSSCETSLHLVKALSTCAEQVTSGRSLRATVPWNRNILSSMDKLGITAHLGAVCTTVSRVDTKIMGLITILYC
jgi:hypothetical protein